MQQVETGSISETDWFSSLLKQAFVVFAFVIMTLLFSVYLLFSPNSVTQLMGFGVGVSGIAIIPIWLFS